MYYAHFGLKEPPFRITPNTELFFSGGNRGAILEALIYALAQGEGIVKVTGEVGSGKTMLCTMLQKRLPPEIETVYLPHPSVSPEEILHAIAFELQLNVPRGAGRMEAMQGLHNYLLERHAQGRQVVIFVEESQNMPLETLEEVRLLSNLETGRHKLLQIVLFGQPELDEKLRQPQIRQLRDRITHSFTLQPFAPDEVGPYLMFRLRAVGYRGPDLFPPRVVRQIADASEGLTRRINLIADKALLAAFSDNTHTIRARHVRAALRDSEFARDRPLPARLDWRLAAGLIGIGAIVGAGAFLLWQLLAGDPARPGSRGASAVRAPAAVASPAPAGPVASGTVVQPTDRAAEPTAATTEGAGTDRAAPVAGAAPAAAGSPGPPEAVPATAAPGSGPTLAPPEPSGGGAREPAPRTPVAAPPPGVAVTQQPRTGPTAAPGADPAPAAPAAPGGTAVTAEPEEPGPPRAESARADLLQDRLDATLDWLRDRDTRPYTIQLLGTDNPQQLREHLKIIGKLVEINNIFVYRSTANQKPYLRVLYGSFDTREAARDALGELPAQLRAFRPYLRSVQAVRDEVRESPAG